MVIDEFIYFAIKKILNFSLLSFRLKCKRFSFPKERPKTKKYESEKKVMINFKSFFVVLMHFDYLGKN